MTLKKLNLTLFVAIYMFIFWLTIKSKLSLSKRVPLGWHLKDCLPFSENMLTIYVFFPCVTTWKVFLRCEIVGEGVHLLSKILMVLNDHLSKLRILCTVKLV